MITLAKAAGHKVKERKVSFDEWRTGTESGKIVEAFACGTAAVITPIGTVRYAGGEFTMPSGGMGDVTRSLRQSLVDIQRGRAEDPYGWVRRVL